MLRQLGRDFHPKHSIDGEYIRNDILEFIASFIESVGYSPSIREIMEGCGYNSTSSVAHHLKVLRDTGKIEYEPRIARSIRITT